MAAIKVMIVDDHEIIRDGVSRLLEGVKDIQIAGTASDGSEALELLKKGQPDIILLDINMPGMDGPETSMKIKEMYPDLKIIAFSMYSEEDKIKAMLKAGAEGYIVKTTGSDELAQAIFSASEGGNCFSEEVAATMMTSLMKSDEHAENDQNNLSEITKREVEVLTLIVNEMTNQEIAKELSISPHTVDTHRRNLLQKLEVKNTVGLIKYAFQNGLVN